MYRDDKNCDTLFRMETRMQFFKDHEILPIFPLPNIVLFPSIKIPLHIFEPRYIEMVQNILDAKGTFCMTTFKGPWQNDYYGTPAIQPTGCLCKIEDYQKLKGGEYHIIIQGLKKVQMQEVKNQFLYREVSIQLMEDLNDITASNTMEEIIDLAKKNLTEKSFLSEELESYFARMGIDEIIYLLSFYCQVEIVEKQKLLEMNSLNRMAQRLCTLYQGEEYI